MSNSPVPTLRNTAGEPERERCSRRANALEGLLVFGAILFLLWPMAFGLGILGGLEWVDRVVHWALWGLFAFVLLVSPRWHGDSLGAWGLGDPRRLRRMLRGARGWRGWIFRAGLAAFFAGLTVLFFRHWPHVADFVGLTKMGLARDPLGWPDSGAGRALVLAVCVALAALIAGAAVRYDNLGSAFRTAMGISLPLLAVVLAGAWVQRGAEAFADLSWSRWALGVAGYVFWGMVQQLLFCGYFGTRFRRGWGPASVETAGENAIARERRTRATLLFGAAFALAGSLAVWLGLRQVHGPGSVTARELAIVAAFFFGCGCAFGHWFGKDKRRMMVAVLSGGAFGLIHIDSWGLVVLTWGVGIVLSYVFMEEARRNVFALGFIHGLLGSTFGSLFSKEKSGVLEIDYKVGPWNVEEPSVWGLAVPVICLVAVGGLIARRA